MPRAIIIGALIALFLRFGLLPLAWFFYEASHVLNVDWLYWGYSVFRGADHAASLYSFRTAACLIAGAAVAAIVYWRSRRATGVQSEP